MIQNKNKRIVLITFCSWNPHANKVKPYLLTKKKPKKDQRGRINGATWSGLNYNWWGCSWLILSQSLHRQPQLTKGQSLFISWSVIKVFSICLLSEDILYRRSHRTPHILSRERATSWRVQRSIEELGRSRL